MFRPIPLFLILVVTLLGCSKELEPLTIQPVSQKDPIPFQVMVYNVENLFDVDDIALFEDYEPDQYSPRHLLTKLKNTAKVVASLNGGKGPEIILFQECEGDQTPSKLTSDIGAAMDRFSGRSLEEVLSNRVASELKDLPSYAWLYKALEEEGITGYQVAVADYLPPPTADDGPTHVNTIFSRFPITETLTHHTKGARSILEVVVDVEGFPVRLFNNHWKSGASRAETEVIRVGNAKVLKRRLDAILLRDPNADIILGGDFNSHYNHAALFPNLPETGINDILGSQGDESAMVGQRGPDLYNLWFELPEVDRGSELYRGRWGTLMHIIVGRGLYDWNGIQIQDGSFRVVSIDGLNNHPVTGRPTRWVASGDGAGFSDHFPIVATFRVVFDNATDRWIDLKNPSRDASGPSSQPRFDYGSITAQGLPAWTAHEIPSKDQAGDFFTVQATVSRDRPFSVRVGEREYGIWSHKKSVRKAVFDSFSEGDSIHFIGEFGRYRGKWQFVIYDKSWIIQNE
ncbi:MAG: endonuclease/exonuclease/phosphatase family protein [Verrucomicrobiota bacterium]